MSRFKALSVILLLIVILLLASMGAHKFYHGVTDSRFTVTYYDVFNTVTEISGYGDDEAAFQRMAEDMYAELLRYHRLYDIYETYPDLNNLKTINDAAGVEPVPVDPEIIELLLFCKDMYAETDGRTNVAMGAVLSLWHTCREEGIVNPEQAKLPDQVALTEAAQHCAMEDVIIDEAAGTVFLKDPDMSLDVGAIAKGFAAKKVAESMEEKGYNHLLLSVGGNVVSVGGHLDGSGFRVGVQNPDESADVAYVEAVEMPVNMSLVSSGDYQRYYVVDGEKYCHIIDPATLYPPRECAGVTVMTEDAGYGDALSTALFIMPLEEGQAFVEAHEGVEAMWILSDGKKLYSSGFRQYSMK